MKPTQERMNQLWREILDWPVGESMAMAMQLMHKCMIDSNSSIIDVGNFDAAAAQEIYAVAARGQATPAALKTAVADLLLVSGGRPRVLKAGQHATPLSGSPQQDLVVEATSIAKEH